MANDSHSPRTRFIFGLRVNTWRDSDSGMFIAEFSRVLESASTREEAENRLLSVLESIGKHIVDSRKQQPGEPHVK